MKNCPSPPHPKLAPFSRAAKQPFNVCSFTELDMCNRQMYVSIEVHIYLKGFFLMYVYACIHMCEHVCRYLREARSGHLIPEASGCELPNVTAGSPTCVLKRSHLSSSVAEAGLKVMVLCLSVPSAGITGMYFTLSSF